MKFLIVDDEPLVRRALARALMSRHHEVHEAADGVEGLKMWKELIPDCLFLDVLMPGLTGPQVISEFGEQKNTFVVMMSAFTGEPAAQDPKSFGADLFLAKPFEDIFSVLDKVESLLK